MFCGLLLRSKNSSLQASFKLHAAAGSLKTLVKVFIAVEISCYQKSMLLLDDFLVLLYL